MGFFVFYFLFFIYFPLRVGKRNDLLSRPKFANWRKFGTGSGGGWGNIKEE